MSHCHFCQINFLLMYLSLVFRVIKMLSSCRQVTFTVMLGGLLYITLNFLRFIIHVTVY